MELQLIDGLSVANVIPDCLILLNIDDTDDTAVTCGCQQRRRCFQII